MTDENSVPVRFRPALEEIVSRLAAGDYDGVANDHSPYAGQDGVDLGVWAREYPDVFVPLPPEAWEVAYAGQVDGEEGVWWVVVALWGQAEGRTDMLLQATVRDASTGIKVQVDDLRVM